MQLPEKFLSRMKSTLGSGFDAFVSSYGRPPLKAVRVNTLKITPSEFAKITPFPLGNSVPWEPNGFFVAEEKAGKSVQHSAGLYYVQEPSAMCAAPLLSASAGERVLDLCSAPGGKGTQLAQAMCGEGVLILNEVNFSRAKILSQNVERLGVTNAAVISETPERIAEHFTGYFDKVLVDAPCSGEGMFKKESTAIPEWSEEAVIACAHRQRLILQSAQRALKPNGLLCYSTCTFAPEEDEWQIENFLKTHTNFKLLSMQKLYPHECEGEGHFVALMQKLDGEECNTPQFRATQPTKKQLTAYRELEKSLLTRAPFQNLHFADGVIYSIPDYFPSLPFKTLRTGMRLAELKGERAEPNHSLAMCLTANDAPCIELDGQSALSYLSGNVVNCAENVRSWALATYLGYPLGWCKAVNGVAKNHLPKGLRI